MPWPSGINVPFTEEGVRAYIQAEEDKRVLAELEKLGAQWTFDAKFPDAPKRFPALNDWMMRPDHGFWLGSLPLGDPRNPCVSREQTLKEHLPLVKKDMWRAIRRAMTIAAGRFASRENFKGLATTVWDILNNAVARLDGEIGFSPCFSTQASGFGQVVWTFAVAVEGPLADFWRTVDDKGTTLGPGPRGSLPLERVEALSVTLEESLFARTPRPRRPKDDWDDWLFEPEDT